jgi:hypothetical protein
VELELNTAIDDLRHVLGDPVYESLARKERDNDHREMVTYAYDQIGPARAQLNAVSK